MYIVLGACVMMTSALQRTETERWGRGISLLGPSVYMASILGPSDSPSDSPSDRRVIVRRFYNPSDTRPSERVYLGMWPWHDTSSVSEVVPVVCARLGLAHGQNIRSPSRHADVALRAAWPTFSPSLECYKSCASARHSHAILASSGIILT